MLPRTLRLFLDGRFAESGIDRPLMYPGDRVLTAERALANTGIEFGDDPRTLAARLGIAVVPGVARDCGGEFIQGDAVLVRWMPDRRDRGLRIFHALAHALLLRGGWEHSHGDVWMLTGDLAVPRRAGRLYDVGELVRCAHAPEAFVIAWLRVAERFGRRAEEWAA